MAVKARVFTTLFLTTFLSGTACLVPNNAWARGGGSSHGRSVQVSGYTRHDGTYVHPYTRSAPGTGSRYSGGSGYSSGSQYSAGSEYNGSSNDPSPTSTTADTFQDALDSAISATTITQSAVSKDDWELVSSKLQNAINLLKEVPISSANYAEAQVKIQEYGAKLNHAKKQLGLPPVIQLQSREVATQATLNDAPQQSEETSVLVEPDTSPIVSSQYPTVTAPVSPSPKVTPTAATASAEITPNSIFNPSGKIIFTTLIILVAIAFYRTKTTKHSSATTNTEKEPIEIPKRPIVSKPNNPEREKVETVPLHPKPQPEADTSHNSTSSNYPTNLEEDATYAVGGAIAGAGVAATVGGMGLAVGGTAVGIGAAPVVVAGTIAGLAVSGAKKAIDEGDATALSSVAGGAVIGAGVSSVVGGMGLAVGGSAVAIGMAPVAAAGAVLGLAAYGLSKLMGGNR